MAEAKRVSRGTSISPLFEVGSSEGSLMFTPVTNFRRPLCGLACLYLLSGEDVISLPRKLLSLIDTSKNLIMDKE